MLTYRLCAGRLSLFSKRKLKPWSGLSRPTSCECLESVSRRRVSEVQHQSHQSIRNNPPLQWEWRDVALWLPVGPSSQFLIIMEYCEKGSLRQVLDSEHEELSWTRKARMCLDAAKGLYRWVMPVIIYICVCVYLCLFHWWIWMMNERWWNTERKGEELICADA